MAKRRDSNASTPETNIDHTKPEVALEDAPMEDIDVHLTEEFARQGRVIDGLKTRVEEHSSEINAVRKALQQAEAERDAALAQLAMQAPATLNVVSDDALVVARDAALAEQARLEQELAKTTEQLMRRAAEFQNYRRRTEQERLGLIDMGKVMVLNPLLDVLDDFERSLEAASHFEGAATDQGFANLKQGVDLVHRKLLDSVQRLGVEQIEAIGVLFDENWHEAMMQQAAPPGIEPGMVVGVLQEGYRLGDRVIRHAKVIVAA